MGLVCQDDGFVVHLVYVFFLHQLDQRRCSISSGIVAELGVDGSHGGVGIHDYLVYRQGDQGASAHGVVGDDYRLLGRMGLQRQSDLGGGEGEPSWRVEYQIYGNIVRGRPYGSQDRLAVIDVDVPGQRYPQEAQGLLPVYQGYHHGLSLLSHLDQKPSPGYIQNAPLGHGDEEEE